MKGQGGGGRLRLTRIGDVCCCCGCGWAAAALSPRHRPPPPPPRGWMPSPAPRWSAPTPHRSVEGLRRQSPAPARRPPRCCRRRTGHIPGQSAGPGCCLAFGDGTQRQTDPETDRHTEREGKRYVVSQPGWLVRAPPARGIHLWWSGGGGGGGDGAGLSPLSLRLLTAQSRCGGRAAGAHFLFSSRSAGRREPPTSHVGAFSLSLLSSPLLAPSPLFSPLRCASLQREKN